MKYDLMLSSGYLAFARHLGVLRAIENRRVEIDAVCGISSGALVGAMYAAGWDSEAIDQEIKRQRPVALTRPHWPPWSGLASLSPLMRRLEKVLPERFEDLQRPLALGVATRDRKFELLRSGNLASAVMASCAIPYLFAPIAIADQIYVDGGAVERVGLEPWRSWRGRRPTLIHLVQRSHGAAGDRLPDDVHVIHSQPSGASLLSLGDVDAQARQSESAAGRVLDLLP